MVGPPLALPVEGLRGDDLLEAGPAVRLHQHRQLLGVRVRAFRARRDDRRVQLVLAQSRKRDVRCKAGFGRRGRDSGALFSQNMPHLGAGGTHIAAGDHDAALAARGGPLAGIGRDRRDRAVVIDTHHVETAGVVVAEYGLGGGRIGPSVRHLRRDFGRALHHGQHILVGHGEHRAHVPASRRERAAVHCQTVGVRGHIVERAHQTTIRRVGGRAVNQVDPLLVRVLLKHTRGTQRGPIRRDCHLKHLIAGLTAVLHQHQRIVAATPVHGGHILVRLAIPIHIGVAGDARVPVVLIERQRDHGQVHVGVAGQRARVAAAGVRLLGVGRIADVPGRLVGGVEGLEQHVLRIRGPPEAVVSVHLLAGHELGQTDFPRVFGRIAVLILHAHAVDRGDAVT